MAEDEVKQYEEDNIEVPGINYNNNNPTSNVGSAMLGFKKDSLADMF